MTTWVVLAGFPAEGMSVRYAGLDEARARDVAATGHQEHVATLAMLNERRQGAGLRPYGTLSDEVHIQRWVDGELEGTERLTADPAPGH